MRSNSSKMGFFIFGITNILGRIIYWEAVLGIIGYLAASIALPQVWQ